MLMFLKVLTLVLVVLAIVSALAHALELPGKMRLTKEQYLVVQPIYYPGFTIAGIAEPLSLLALIALLFWTPTGSPAFWLVAGALILMLAMHAAYWLVTHPVNEFWLKDVALKGVAAGFFSVKTGDTGSLDWTRLRNRWEYSHVLRAILGLLALILLATAVAL